MTTERLLAAARAMIDAYDADAPEWWDPSVEEVLHAVEDAELTLMEPCS